MRFVIHAGVHKTGTSTLQNFLADNADALLERGVYYPVGFFAQFTRQHSALAFAIRRGDVDLVRGFFEHCREQEAHTTVVSGEQISVLSGPSLRRLRSEIIDIDASAEIDVILYYRNLYDVSISLLQQLAKGNRRLFGDPRDKRVVSRLDPTRQIAKFEDVFGDSPVKVGIFDTAVRGAGLERDFVQLAGLGWTDDLVHTASRNVSMDLISTAFLNMLGLEYGLKRTAWRSYARVTTESRVLPTLRNRMTDELRATVATIDVSHPKLRHARPILTEAKQAPEDQRPDLSDFLGSFEAFVHEVRMSLDGPPRRGRAKRD